MLKLFDHGHSEELRHANALRRAGLNLVDTQHAVSALGGILRGHTDGFVYIDHATVNGELIADEWMLWEMKTSNHKSFLEVVNHGVKEKKPVHYAQMQLYMGLTDFDVSRALYTVTDKDTDTIHFEVVPFDETEFVGLMAKAERVVWGDLPPRAYKTPTHFKCRYCDAAQVCWGEDAPPRQCGSCTHWKAGKCGLTGAAALQDACCDQYEINALLDQQRKDFTFWT
jgi:hypothetical protein